MEPADYTEAKRQVAEGPLSGAQQHDKAILTLSAGALALSVTFVEKIAAKPDPDTYFLLAWSWGLFVASIVSTILSFQSSMLAYRRHDKILDTLFSLEETDSNKLKNHWVYVTLTLNLVSLVLFVAGTVLLLAYSYENFPR